MTSIKILFGITGLTIGGAERVLVDLCNKLSFEHDITIFTIYSKGEFEKELSDRVTLKSLYNFSYNEMSKLKKMLLPLKIFFTKKSIYKKYVKGDHSTEVAFLEGPITNIFGIKNQDVQKIVWIHNDISVVFGTGIKAKIKKILNKNVYKKYSKLVFVSSDNLEKFEKTYEINNEKHVIYNYIDPDKIIEKASKVNKDILKSIDNSQISFLSVCRLVEQKAIERLINVHSRLIKDGINHKIYIAGDGPLKEKLEEKIIIENVQNSFILLGQKDNPYPYVKKANVFCLLSYYEGYPIVVEEAKILNKFITITDTAAREVVRNYDNKLIAKNSEDGIYNAIKEVVENKEKYLDNNLEFNYSNDDILEKVEKLLNKANGSQQ